MLILPLLLAWKGLPGTLISRGDARQPYILDVITTAFELDHRHYWMLVKLAGERKHLFINNLLRTSSGKNIRLSNCF
jgi:hypothetical protein